MTRLTDARVATCDDDMTLLIVAVCFTVLLLPFCAGLFGFVVARTRPAAEDHTNDDLMALHDAIHRGDRIPNGPLAAMHFACAEAWADSRYHDMCDADFDAIGRVTI